MRGTILFAVTALAIVISSCASTHPGPVLPSSSSDYVSASSFARQNGLDKIEKDHAANKVLLAGQDKSVLLCLGMKTAVVNSQPVPLEDVTIFHNNDFQITSRSAKSITTALNSHRPVPQQVQPKPSKGYLTKIVIDPGHGGDFPGAVGPTGLEEKDVVLDVALKLRKILETKGITVVMTRDSDKSLTSNLKEDLKERVKVNNSSKSDLFISIHANSEGSGSADGFEVYYARKDPEDISELIQKILGSYYKEDVTGAPASSIPENIKKILARLMIDEFLSESKDIAEAVRKEFAKAFTTNDRGVKEAGFYVIKWAQTPAILIEIDFISNRDVEKDLKTQAYKQKIAEAIARAIMSYKAKFDGTERFTRQPAANN